MLQLTASTTSASKRGDVALGYVRHWPIWRLGNEESHGSPGARGSIGSAKPQGEAGYAHITSKMGTSLTGNLLKLHSEIPFTLLSRLCENVESKASVIML